ncbi:MAG: hypothetical protein ACXVAX_11465, partial [Pseudobdellovibrio sp.]
EMSGAIAGSLFWIYFAEKLGFKGFLALHLLTFAATLFFKAEKKFVKIILAALAVGVFALGGEPQPLFNKRERYDLLEKGTLLDSKWNTNAHVELIESKSQPGKKLILFDGGVLRSTVYEFNGNYQQAREALLTPKNVGVWSLDVAAPAFVLKDQMDKVLLISAVGGQEIFAAKAFGAKEIVAADINGAAQSFARDELKDYNAHLYDDKVQVETIDGRKIAKIAAEETHEKFDLIQIYSASNAAYLTGMGLGLKMGSLVTAEAIQFYVRALSETGILSLSQPNYWQIKETLMQVDRPHNVLAITASDNPDFLKSFYLKKNAWKQNEVDDLMAWLARDPLHKWEILIDPFKGETEAGKKLNLDIQKPQNSKLAVPIDDRPFVELTESPLNLIQVRVLLAAFILAAIGIYFLPKTSWTKFKNKSSLYFTIGILFGLVQQSAIYFMQKQLGMPDWGLVIALVVSLAASILALQLSEKVKVLNLKLGFGILLACAAFNFYMFQTGDVINGLLLFLLMPVQSFIFIKRIKNDLAHIRWAWWTNGLGFVFGVCGFYVLFAFVGMSWMLNIIYLSYGALFFVAARREKLKIC